MSGAVFAVILAAALMGGGAAFLAWSIVLPLFARPQAAAPAAQPVGPAQAAPAADTPGPKDGEVDQPPLFPDPTLNAQIAAMRKDLAEIARVQIELLEGMADRENQMLGEMRAVVSQRDPELLNSLTRIEALLTGAPPPELGTLLEDDDDVASENVPETEDDDIVEIGRV